MVVEMVLKYINTEHELNKALKDHKINTPNDPCYILYYSPWGEENIMATTSIINVIMSMKKQPKTYMVDLSEVPHASVIFGVTTTPTLIVIEDNKVSKLDRFCEIVKKMDYMESSGRG